MPYFVSSTFYCNILLFQFVNYYEFKENNPEFYEGVNLKCLMKMGDDSIITVPPYRDQTGRRILLYRIGKLHLTSVCYLA